LNNIVTLEGKRDERTGHSGPPAQVWSSNSH
jgi:hypothetical protein